VRRLAASCGCPYACSGPTVGRILECTSLARGGRRTCSRLEGILVKKIAIAILACSVAMALGAWPASGKAAPAKSVYVDCEAAPAGNGSKNAPFSSITAALAPAKAFSATSKVTISVASGICDQETLPIQLDFPVVLQGARSPEMDEEGLPLNGQDQDTLVTWVPPSPVPPSVAALPFFRITGANVRISKLSIDGKIIPGTPGVVAPGATAPLGLLVQNAKDFTIDQLRITRTGASVRTQGNASGRIRDIYIGTVNAGIVLTGGDPTAPPMVMVTNNRIEDYWTGALALAGAGAAGQSIRAVIEGNDTTTRFADTGPSNPFAVRIGPILAGSPFLQGTIEASFLGNRFRGTPRYAIIVNGGMTTRRPDGRRYSGGVDVSFADNLIETAGITGATSLITFTNSRATELPCELDPANTLVECPSLMGNPLQYWEYLEASVFDLHHTGELDGALIDHPEIESVDGRVLGNRLLINDAEVDHATFVVVP
jgi:hypothetical protein